MDSSHRGPLLALLSVPLALAAFDAAIGPRALYGRHPELYPLLWGESLALLVRLAWFPLLVQAISVGLQLTGRLRPRALLAVQVALGAALAIHLLMLSRLRAPLMLPVAAIGPLFVVTPLALALANSPRRKRLAAVCAVCMGILGAVALAWSVARYSERYLTVSATVLSTVIAVWLLHSLTILWQRLTVPRGALVALSCIAAVLLLVPRLVTRGEASAAVARSYTVIGRAATRFDEKHPELRREPVAAAAPGRDAGSGAMAELTQRAGLPLLAAPRERPLNILLITSEATRFDQTSLASAALGTTPSLAAFVESGAHWFSAAHAPSHVTLQSVSALHTLTFPSAAPLELWDVPWHGELRPEALTIAEVLSAAGYATWMASHGSRAMECCILGFDQGFQQIRYVRRNPAHAVEEIDREVADLTIASIERSAREARPFFGWAFLGSPHHEYEARYPDMPARTQQERYLHDVRYMDEQLGRIIAAIRGAGIEDSTIVIYTSDHGEELFERGALGHLTLHRECTHVPLAIRIPHTQGGRVDTPSSSLHAVAWALLHAEGAARSFAEQQLAMHLLPVLRAGGDRTAYSELISPEGSGIALTSPDGARAIGNLARHWYALYDWKSDPGERVDVRLQNPFERSDLDARIESILNVRREQARYKLVDRGDPAKRL